MPFSKEDLASLGHLLVNLCDPAASANVHSDFSADPGSGGNMLYIYLNRQTINGAEYGWYQRRPNDTNGQIVNMPLPNAALTATLKKIRIVEKLKSDPNFNSHKIVFDLEGATGTKYSIEGGWKSKQGGMTIPVKMLLSSMQFADLSRPITITTNVSPDKATVSFANVFQDGVQLYPEKGQVAEGNFVEILKHLTKTHNIPLEIVKAEAPTPQAAPAQGYGYQAPPQTMAAPPIQHQQYAQQPPTPAQPMYGQQQPPAYNQQPQQPMYGQSSPTHAGYPPMNQPMAASPVPDLADFNAIGNTAVPGGGEADFYDSIPF